jgi:hypothetical protein
MNMDCLPFCIPNNRLISDSSQLVEAQFKNTAYACEILICYIQIAIGYIRGRQFDSLCDDGRAVPYLAGIGKFLVLMVA